MWMKGGCSWPAPGGKVNRQKSTLPAQISSSILTKYGDNEPFGCSLFMRSEPVALEKHIQRPVQRNPTNLGHEKQTCFEPSPKCIHIPIGHSVSKMWKMLTMIPPPKKK